MHFHKSGYTICLRNGGSVPLNKDDQNSFSLRSIFTDPAAETLITDIEDRIIDADKIFGRETPLQLLIRSIADQNTPYFHLDEKPVLGINYSSDCTQTVPSAAVNAITVYDGIGELTYYECNDISKIGELSEGDVSLMRPMAYHRAFHSTEDKYLPRLWVGIGPI